MFVGRVGLGGFVGRRSQAGNAALIAALALLVSGCGGGLSLGSKPPPPTYDLFAAQSFPRRSGPPRGQLIVVEPTALAVLDTEKIVVRPSPDEVAQLGNAQWQDRLPKLLQARVVQSFENASRLRAVGKPGDKLVADFQLVIDVRAFEISATGSTADVVIAAKIVRERTGRVVAARIFRASVPSAGTEGPSAVAALNDAFANVAVQLVLWAARLV